MMYIVAGTRAEYQHWLRTNALNPAEHKYVSDIDMLRGVSNIHGRFIGSFRNRTDLPAIIMQIAVSNTTGHTMEFKNLIMEAENARSFQTI